MVGNKMILPVTGPDTPKVYYTEEGFFSPDGRRVLTTTSAYGIGSSRWGETQVWDAVTGQPLSTPMRQTNVVYFAAWSPDGERFVTSCEDGKDFVCDARSGKPITPPLIGGRAAFSPDGKRLAVTGSGERGKPTRAFIYDAETGVAVGQPLSQTSGMWIEFQPGWPPSGYVRPRFDSARLECRHRRTCDAASIAWRLCHGGGPV